MAAGGTARSAVGTVCAVPTKLAADVNVEPVGASATDVESDDCNKSEARTDDDKPRASLASSCRLSSSSNCKRRGLLCKPGKRDDIRIHQVCHLWETKIPHDGKTISNSTSQQDS